MFIFSAKAGLLLIGFAKKVSSSKPLRPKIHPSLCPPDSKMLEVKEWYKNREDVMERRELNKKTEVTTEFFAPGHVQGLKGTEALPKHLYHWPCYMWLSCPRNNLRTWPQPYMICESSLPMCTVPTLDQTMMWEQKGICSFPYPHPRKGGLPPVVEDHLAMWSSATGQMHPPADCFCFGGNGRFLCTDAMICSKAGIKHVEEKTVVEFILTSPVNSAL